MGTCARMHARAHTHTHTHTHTTQAHPPTHTYLGTPMGTFKQTDNAYAGTYPWRHSGTCTQSQAQVHMPSRRDAHTHMVAGTYTHIHTVMSKHNDAHNDAQTPTQADSCAQAHAFTHTLRCIYMLYTVTCTVHAFYIYSHTH